MDHAKWIPIKSNPFIVSLKVEAPISLVETKYAYNVLSRGLHAFFVCSKRRGKSPTNSCLGKENILKIKLNPINVKTNRVNIACHCIHQMPTSGLKIGSKDEKSPSHLQGRKGGQLYQLQSSLWGFKILQMMNFVEQKGLIFCK